MAQLMLGCGAKTGLWVPCTIPVVPSTAQVVVLVDHSTQAGFPYTFYVPPGGGHIDEFEFGPTVASLAQSLPALDADPVGAPTASALYLFPELGVANIERDGVCATPSGLLLPLRPAGTQAILDQLHTLDDGTGDYARLDPHNINFPFGSQNVWAALQVARRALDAAPAPAPRFIVLETEGGPTCNDAIAPAACQCYSAVSSCLATGGVAFCADLDRVIATIAQFAAADIRTLVIADEVDPAALPLVAAFEAGAAEAGGLAQAGPHPWYGVHEPAAAAAALRTRVAPAGWCQPRAATPPPDPADWVLESTTRGLIARDATHAAGWDWVDAAAGTLRLYGAACDAAMRDRGGLQLVAQHQRCFE